MANYRLFGRVWFCSAIALLVSAGTLLGQGSETTAFPNVAAKHFPNDNAVILRWEQHWTVHPDGSVTRREHKLLRPFNLRLKYTIADPRLDYREGQDELTIHTAQTILPNGDILKVPEYSFNVAAPNDVGGWPEYADWEQMVVSFSGFQKDAVMEWDYQVTTKTGVLPWIWADLRLHQEFPTVERTILVTVPDSMKLRYQLDGLTPAPRVEKTSAKGSTTYRWVFNDLDGRPAEPQSLPWQKRCARLRFTTCESTSRWVGGLITRVDQAGQPSAHLKKFAESIIEQETNTAEQVKKIAGYMHDTFNFINSFKAWRTMDCRSASEVLTTNYGHPLEAGALLLGLLRACDIEAVPHAAVKAVAWDERVPTESAFDGIVLTVNLQDEQLFMHPQHGVFTSPGNWGRHWLLSVGETGNLKKTYISARGENERSQINVTGKLKLDDEGKVTGDLRIRLKGAFYDPSKLQTADKQKNLVKRTVNHVLSDLELENHSIITLSDQTLEAVAQVKSKGALKKAARQFILTLGDGPAFLPDFPLPLAMSTRSSAVHTAGAFIEEIDIAIELPEGWSAPIIPASFEPVEGPWGRISQTAQVDGQTVRLQRSIEIKTDTLVPDDFQQVRLAVNNLRASGSRVLAFTKKDQ